MSYERHQNGSYLAGLTLAFAAAVAVIGGAAWELGTRTQITFAVAEKNPAQVAETECGRGDIFYIKTKEGEVLENKPALLSGKFREACAIQNFLQEGHHYKADVYGLRKFNQLRNIIGIKADVTPPPSPSPPFLPGG